MIVSTDQLYVALGLTKRRINQLCREGVLQRLKQSDGALTENQFDLLSCETSYLDYKLAALTPSSTDADYNVNKLKLWQARADQARIRATVLREDLLSARCVECVTVAMWGFFKERLDRFSRGFVP